METNFDTTTLGSSQGNSQNFPGAEPIETFSTESETQSLPSSDVETSDQKVFASESDAIMDIPGTPHQKLEALAQGQVGDKSKTPLEETEETQIQQPKEKLKDDVEIEDALEEKVLKLQQLVLTMMLKQMQEGKKIDTKDNTELLAKIKKIIEEAQEQKDVSSKIMSALMILLFMVFTFAEKGTNT